MKCEKKKGQSFQIIYNRKTFLISVQAAKYMTKCKTVIQNTYKSNILLDKDYLRKNRGVSIERTGPRVKLKRKISKINRKLFSVSQKID